MKDFIFDLTSFFYPILCSNINKNEIIKLIEFTNISLDGSYNDLLFLTNFGEINSKNINLSDYIKHIIEFELLKLKLYFNIKDDRIIKEYNFFKFHLTTKESLLIFGINETLDILVYIDQYNNIYHIKLEKDDINTTNEYIILKYQLSKIFYHDPINLFNRDDSKVGTCINLQWHITNKCENKCKHCYIQNDSLSFSLDKEFTFDEAKRVIDDVYKYSLEEKRYARISLSGGDPLLCDFFWDLLHYANKNRLYPLIKSILGNSNLIDNYSAKKLKEFNIEHYQMSLEGLKEINDDIRGTGNWDDVWRAIDILEDNRISTNIMFTLSKSNYNQLIPLIDYIAENKNTNFSFARYCAISNDDKLGMLSSIEFKNLLIRVVETYRYWSQERNLKRWDLYKDPLFALIYKEMHIDFFNSKPACCLLGNGKSLALLPNHKLLYCRRMTKEIGSWFDISCKDALKMQKDMIYTNIKINSCSKCDCRDSCRGGCIAINYAISGLADEKDPQCWRIDG